MLVPVLVPQLHHWKLKLCQAAGLYWNGCVHESITGDGTGDSSPESKFLYPTVYKKDWSLPVSLRNSCQVSFLRLNRSLRFWCLFPVFRSCSGLLLKTEKNFVICSIGAAKSLLVCKTKRNFIWREIMEQYWKQLDRVLLEHWKWKVVALNRQLIMADCEWEIYLNFRIVVFLCIKDHKKIFQGLLLPQYSTSLCILQENILCIEVVHV